MGKCMNIWHGREAFLIKLLKMDFMDLLHYSQFKDALIIGRVDTKSSWQEMRLKALRSLWISLDIKKVLWNYLEMNCVLNSCNLWALYVLPLCRDVWLLGDFLARYYSLCDIGILAPVFMTAYEFRLCDDIWVLSLWWRWVPSLWWQISSGCVWVMSFVFVTALSRGLGFDFQVLEWCFDSSQNIVCSFMLRYFEKVLCCIVLIILVILPMKMNLLDFHWNSQSITCFVKCPLSWDLHFSHPH